MYVADRIKSLMDEKGYSFTDMENLTGISRSTIYNYANGKTDIPLSRLPAIASALGTTAKHLMGWDSNTSPIGRISMYPVTSNVKCGYGAKMQHEYTGEHIEIPTSMLKGYPENECFVTRAVGNSMLPKIEEGDTLLVHEQQDVDSGELAIVLITGEEEITVKKIKKDDGMITLIPYNEDYPVMVYRGKSLANVMILGKVFRIMKEC